MKMRRKEDGHVVEVTKKTWERIYSQTGLYELLKDKPAPGDKK